MTGTDGDARALYFTGPREVAVRERPVPTPDAGEVRVRTVVSAISPGTELLVYRGDAPDELAADDAIDALEGSLSFPLQYGYATVGVVTAVGDGVADPDSWHGRRVFAFHPHESHFCAPPDDLLAVPADCPTEAAAFLPNVETAVNFLLDGDPRLGERVVVFGQGVVGLLTTALLAVCPVETVVAVDRHAARRELSAALGADETLDADRDDLPDAIRDAVSGPETEGADLTYELSGSPVALDDAISVTGYDGRVIVGSWYGRKRADLDLGGRFHRSRLDLVSSQVSTIDPALRGRWSKARRLDTAWRWLDRIDPRYLVTHRVSVADADAAYRALDERPEDALQVLLTY